MRILVVEDDPVLSDGLKVGLGLYGATLDIVSSCADGHAALAADDFDALVLDLMLPDGDGLDFTRELRGQPATRRLPLMMLTARGEPTDRIVGLELGADDYLPKPFEPRELLLRVSALLRRAAPPAHTAHAEVKMGDATYDPERGQLKRKGKPVHLTSSEAALLKLFAANAGRSFSRTDLCTRLGVALERSIDVQVTRLRRKSEEDPKLPLYLQTVRGVGYVLVPDRVT